MPEAGNPKNCEVVGVGWDDLVIDAVGAHYGLDKAVMALPKAERPTNKT